MYENNGLFGNTGGFIKGFAKVSFYIEVIASIIGAIAMIVSLSFLYAVIILIGGILTALITSQFIYSYGVIVDAAKQNYIQNNMIINSLNALNKKLEPAVNTPAATANTEIDLPEL